LTHGIPYLELDKKQGEQTALFAASRFNPPFQSGKASLENGICPL